MGIKSNIPSPYVGAYCNTPLQESDVTGTPRWVAYFVAFAIVLSLAIPAMAQYSEDDPPPVNVTTKSVIKDGLLDINQASDEQLKTLGITEKEQQLIRDRIRFEGPFETFYDLFDVEGLPRETVEGLRDKIIVRTPGMDDPVAARREANSYRIEQLVSDDGFSEGLADQLADQLLDPINVNEATIDELTDIQNVSAVDAVAIKKRIVSGNPIVSQRELRQTPGLSHYGYTNARPYLTYEPTEKFKQVHGFFQVRMFDSPYLPGNADAVREDVIAQSRLDTHYKLRLNYIDWKMGLSMHRGRNELSLTEHPFGNTKFTQGKFFFEKDYTNLGSITIKRFIVGNFQAGFGEGLIFSSGDYFSPRATGFGYSKHLSGILGDLSRNEEFTYRGVAVEARGGPIEATAFLSSDWKDAVLNPDGSINRFIVLSPRVHYDSYPAVDSTYPNPSNPAILLSTKVDRHPGVQSFLDNTRETILAGNVSFLPVIGVRFGMSWVEAMYNRPLRPTLDTNNLVLGSEFDEINDDFANREITDAYSSSWKSDLWKQAKSKVRVYGFNWQTVFNNFSWQGEWGELEKTGSVLRLGDDPKALVTSFYTQYPSFNLMLLYRNRDVGYDNPYDRGYANYARFKGTIFEDEYYLRDATFGQLYDNSFQPQPEKGWMLSGRYQLLRQLVTSFELDQWTRKSDDAEYYRWVVRGQYRPIFPLQFNLRFSDQARAYLNQEDKMYYRALQGRLQTRVRLTNFDEVTLLYSYAVTRFAPRPRLVYDVDPNGNSPVSGQSASPAEAMGFSFRHNLSRPMWIGGGATIYDGFFWNYEEGDFYVRDGNGLRLYVAMGSRIGPGLYIKAKLTSERSNPITYIAARDGNEPPSRSGETAEQLQYAHPFAGDNVTGNDLSFRLQLDYHF
ncbi:MAG: hypothetical protein OEM52_09375 [bacterium]|nr:hypothetical protein [bacterium]